MAINFKAGGELTISDISDSKQLTSLISSLFQRQVIFDPNDNTYSPNYASKNNVLVPQLFVTGNMEDIISSAKSVNWFYQVDSIGTKIPITGNTTDYTLDAVTKKLTIKTNVLQVNNSMNYIAEIVYTDPDTGMDIKNISTIELLKITNGTNGVSGDNPVIAVLSNDSHTIPSNSDGLEMNFSGATSEFQVYEGIEDVTREWSVMVTASSGIIGSLRNLGSITLGNNLYNQTIAKNVYMYYGAEQPSNEEDWTSDFIEIELNTDYLYKQIYTNELSYVATPYTCFTYYDKDKNYLYQEVKEESGLAIGTSKEFSYEVKSSVAGVKYVRTNGNLMYDGAFFARYFSEGVIDSRVIYDITGMTVDAGYVDFVATKNADTLTKRFTLTKVRRGVTGSNAQLLYLSANAETMNFGNSGEPIPAIQTITLIAKTQNVTGTPSFTASPFDEAGTKLADIVLGGSGTTRTLTQAQWSSNFSRVVITAIIGGLSDTITIVKLVSGTAGKDAVVGYLTNESVTLGASQTGVIGDFSASSGTFKVYDGFTDKTSSAEVAYTKVSNTGCIASISSTGAYSVTAMSADTATVVMNATYKTVVISKTLTLSKSKTGLSGDNARAYWITNSVGAIKKNDAGAYVPSTITVNALSQEGTTPPAPYAGRFIISETTNGTTWVDRYTSSVNESTKVYTPSAGITSLKIRMYMAGGATSLVDEQNVPVISDGSDPVIAILSTPFGSIIKNSSGNLTLEATLYKGGTTVTPTAYKWYELDTSVSGGWRQLTSANPDGTTGYTTKTLTVTPATIASVATFKVEATYNGLTYTDMATLTDLSDPISVIIIGSGIYKNGQGINSYTARLYRNGSEIDVSGTTYLYKWNLLNSNGTINVNFSATGKTINIPSSAFDETAQLKCDIDDRK